MSTKSDDKAPVAEKREREDSNETNVAKKQKSTGTIPISRGRFKQRFLAKHSSLLKRSDTASGIMVSCTVGSETRALGQVKNFLDSTVHTLFPEHELTWERFEGDLDVPELVKNKGDGKEEYDEKEEEDNVKANEENEKEEQGQEPSNRKDKRFQGVDSACSGLLFFRFRINVKPTDFMSKLIEHKDIIDAKKIKHSSRFIPIDYICPATTDRMTKCFERLREQELDSIKADTKVAIVTEIRNNISLKKPDIIQLIAPMIPKEHFTVDLTKPDIVIFCTIFKSVCGMSVLRDYYPRKKYNLIALLEDK